MHWPYGDKTFEQSLACVQKGIDCLLADGVDMIIVPPVYELFLLQDSVSISQKKNILPLFTTYLLDYCFKYSLVGKIGLIGDFADMQIAQSLLQALEKHYVLGEHQQSIKKFHRAFVYRAKEMPLWKYYLTNLSYSNVLVNKIIKFDLRYFKDAMVDTVIPFNYGYFHYKNTITKFFNFKKIRFHSLESLESVFVSLVDSAPSSGYSIKIISTGHVEFLKREKRLLWLLQRGKNIEITYEHI
ncbi:MAG: hypothetical protein WCH65_03735 [bacterium]